ncbi:MAG: hypothetical protein ABII82_12825 [Verrucomicrobiota bacterium]
MNMVGGERVAQAVFDLKMATGVGGGDDARTGGQQVAGLAIQQPRRCYRILNKTIAAVLVMNVGPELARPVCRYG